MQIKDTIRRWPVAGGVACITLAALAAFHHERAAEPAPVFATAATPATPTPARVHDAIARTPLGFEAGEQAGTFRARGPGQAMLLSPTGATWTLQAPRAKGDAQPAAAARVTMRILAASADAAGHGLEPQAARSHYFTGNDASQWRHDVERFGKVRYDGVYPGVDLVYYGNQRNLEYDFVVAPGADPSRIALAFDGVDGVSLDEAGNLVLATTHGRLLQHKPVVYQEDGARRTPVEGRYAVHGDRVAFEVGAYDRSRALVIDPVITYGTYLGGSDAEAGHGIAVDAQGNFYVAGVTASLDFPTKSAADPSAAGDRSDAFVAKYNATGALVYATYLGGSSQDWLEGIAVDGNGLAYVVGWTDSPNFPTLKAIQAGPTSPGGRAVFVSRFGAGGALQFSTYLGGGADYGEAIAVDNAGHAYVTGLASYNFPTTPGVINTTTQWGDDVFVSKLDTSAGTLVYSTYIDGTDTGSHGRGIAVDAAGCAYVTGMVSGHNFPVVGGGFPEPDLYNGDAFVAKLAPDARSLLFSSYFGGTGTEFPTDVAIDGAGNAIITGLTQASDLPVLNPVQATFHGGWADAYVAKFNTTGGGLVYATYLGGNDDEGEEEEMGVAVDAGGNAYVAGSTYSADFPVKNAVQGTLVGTQAGYVSVFSPAGALLASTFLGAEQYSYTQVMDVAVSGNGTVYVTGTIDGTELPVPGAAQLDTDPYYWDAFVLRIGAAPPPEPRPTTDLNGDKKDDVVWRHATTGADAIWLGANSATTRAMNGVTDVAWEIVGIGDFGADGVADVFWRNRNTGANAIWKGANYATQQAPGALTDLDWKVVGVGDLDGDKKADVVWRNGKTGANVLWRAGVYAGRLALTGVTNLAWKVVGVADFDGDGKDDVLWRNTTTGANTYWPAGNAAAAVAVTGVTKTSWAVVATADFNGDGKDDILWRDGATGSNVIWRSANSADQQAVAAVRDLAFKVVGSGDYNGDAKADVLWRHDSSGSNVIWRSANSATQQAVTRVSDVRWRVMH